MKWLYALIILLMLGCIGANFNFDEVKLFVEPFPLIIHPAIHLTLNRTTIKELMFSKTVISYDYTFKHVYDSSAVEFNLQELIIDIPKDTTFYYMSTGWTYSYGGESITEHAKFCHIPYDDLLKMANAPTITIYMYGKGYTIQTSGIVIGLKEWLENKKK